jgi:hypothetical protein
MRFWRCWLKSPVYWERPEPWFKIFCLNRKRGFLQYSQSSAPGPCASGGGWRSRSRRVDLGLQSSLPRLIKFAFADSFPQHKTADAFD